MGTRFDPSRRQHSVWSAENVDDGRYSHAIPVTPEYSSDTEFDGLFYQERRDECDRLMGEPTLPINYHHDPNTEIPGGITEEFDEGYNYFVTSQPWVWDNIPTREPDNGTLTLLDTYKYSWVVPDLPNIPPEYLPPSYIPGEVREIDAYRYKAEFTWDNGSRNIGLRDLLDIEKFAYNRLGDGKQAFLSGENLLQMTALKDLDTSNLTNMYRMFEKCYWLNEPLDHFDTSNVTNMSEMFYSNFKFNQPLSTFDTSKVTNMTEMFNAAVPFDQDISNWCVQQIPSKPTDFDTGSLLSQSPAKQPKWGVPC